MLTRDGVVLPLDHLLSHSAGVLFGNVEVACASRAVQANFDGGRLRHETRPIIKRIRSAADKGAVFRSQAGPS